MVRSMLSESRAVISRPCLRVGGGRVAAHEIMIGIPAIRNLIRERQDCPDVLGDPDRDDSRYADRWISASKQLVARGLVDSGDAKTKAMDPNSI